MKFLGLTSGRSGNKSEIRWDYIVYTRHLYREINLVFKGLT